MHSPSAGPDVMHYELVDCNDGRRYDDGRRFEWWGLHDRFHYWERPSEGAEWRVEMWLKTDRALGDRYHSSCGEKSWSPAMILEGGINLR